MLLRFVVDRLRGLDAPAPAMTLAELQRAGFATGLTALAAELAVDEFATDLQPYLHQQRDQVAARVERFRPVLAKVLKTLGDVAVPATPVKGAELINGIWPYPSARPMSDVDMIVPVELRAQATAALVAAGFTFDGASPHEDTFLAWGDGSTGRIDGESVNHNGRVELHPGWGEFIHGYVVHGFSIDAHTAVRPLAGAECARLDLDAVTAAVIGHLSSTVVRCEVRALNVVDVWFCHAGGVEWRAVSALLDECDPRLTGPGLWLMAQLLADVVPAELVDQQLERLSDVARRRLATLDPAATLRDASARTTLGWRQAFTMRPGERAAVLQQMARSARVRR
jgi:Uncharacterised nucleotidyltransferase